MNERTALRSGATTPAEPIELKRQIGLYAATAITVGNIIGSGIFRSPHSVAQHLSGFWIVLAAWVVGGVLSICGSLVLAELAVASPKTGGLYVFIRESFGDAFGFVFGWANLWVIKPTVIASITSVFALYFCQVLHLPKSAEFPSGAAAILVLTFINWLGAKEGAGTQSLFTTLKVVGIAMLCVAAFALPTSHAATPVAAAAPVAAFSFGAFAVAMISILFAYDGWTDSTYVAGEIVEPKRTLPIAIVWGTWLVIAVYVLTNIAYYHVLGADGVARYEAVGSETIHRLMGDWGARALAVLVAVSTFGTTNGAILTGPRVTQAMAADGLLWKPLARLDPRRGTPSLALWIQGVLSCVWLWCASGFEDVSGWFVTTSWAFYALTTAALFVQRRKESRGGIAAPSYRTPFFPFPALLFIVATAMIIVSDLHDSGWKAWAGVGIAALGFPVYFVWKGRRPGTGGGGRTAAA
ncbi:MAG: amino acid permease [Candidatus Eisenbacteria bacterium]|uniref:Amino acid permease n=1 Tax=Eiseniibacteriota bacterium TaxID=2212470 RepID=A0A9D6L6N7_UNCEI|nr:amino acid permease [Candidatus Eisenbacteria bacterium]MBI3539771.1 amino acid permease [Candidatus Eisenbacteria bacterium]